MPLPLFIRASVKDDMHALVISGFPTDEELRKAWLDINSEYREIVNGGGDSYSDNLSRANYLGGKILSVHMLVQALLDTGDEDYADLLREHYPDIDFNLDDPETLLMDLESAKAEVMLEENELNEIQELMQREQAKQGGKATNTAAVFDKSLLAINRNEKMVYKAQDLTTRQYAELLNALNKAASKPQKYHGDGSIL